VLVSSRCPRLNCFLQRKATEPLLIGDGRRFTALIVGIVAVFTISLALLVSYSNETRRGVDDAYITYQYAKNIAHGHGFVFNVGDQPTLGTSTPLYAGLLALGARLGIVSFPSR